MLKNDIAYKSATYMRDLTVYPKSRQSTTKPRTWFVGPTVHVKGFSCEKLRFLFSGPQCAAFMIQLTYWNDTYAHQIMHNFVAIGEFKLELQSGNG